MEKLVIDNGNYVVNGEVVDTPEFPVEWFPSADAMEPKESGEYLHALMDELSLDSNWNNIVPICPICKSVAKWTHVEDTSVDMAILHSELLGWALDHNCDNQIRNADNKLVRLRCGCELTIKDRIIKCPVPDTNKDMESKIDYASGVLTELLEIIETDEKIAELLKEGEEINKKLYGHLKYLFDEKLREEYVGAIRPTIRIKNFVDKGDGNFSFDIDTEKQK